MKGVTVLVPVGNGGNYEGDVSIADGTMRCNRAIITNPVAYVEFLRRYADEIERANRILIAERK